MDPDKLLRVLRDLAKTIEDKIDSRVDIEDPLEDPDEIEEFIEISDNLAEGFLALDEWIKKDGFLPKDWE